MRLSSDNGLDDYYKESLRSGLSLRVPLSFCENRTIFSSLFIGLSVFSLFSKGKTILYSCKLSSQGFRIKMQAPVAPPLPLLPKAFSPRGCYAAVLVAESTSAAPLAEHYWSEASTTTASPIHHYCCMPLPSQESNVRSVRCPLLRLLHHTALASLFATFGLGHLQE